jgi:hypothetical protein
VSLETYFGHLKNIITTPVLTPVTLFFRQIQISGADVPAPEFTKFDNPNFTPPPSIRPHRILLSRSCLFVIMTSTITADRAEEAATGTGRGKGMPNFRVEEDLLVAAAYAAVTVDAAIGTDQNGATFWGKIKDLFVEKGGNAGRSAVSIQNRFHRYLQTDVNRYIGLLQSSMREYHSGWSLEDYYNDAKRKYLAKYEKPFK